jgi:hypothetical protein
LGLSFGIIRYLVDTHLRSHLVGAKHAFWELQCVEGALYLAAAALLISFTFWWIARKDA